MVQKGLYDFKSWIMPSMDPQAAANETKKETTLKVCRSIHLLEKGLILFWTITFQQGNTLSKAKIPLHPESPQHR